MYFFNAPMLYNKYYTNLNLEYYFKKLIFSIINDNLLSLFFQYLIILKIFF